MVVVTSTHTLIKQEVEAREGASSVFVQVIHNHKGNSQQHSCVNHPIELIKITLLLLLLLPAASITVKLPIDVPFS